MEFIKFEQRKRNLIRISYVVLIFWCLLPVVMFLFNIAAGLAGKLFPLDSMTEAAESYDLGTNYLLPISAYHLVYRILGTLTILCGLFIAVSSWRSLAARKNIRTMPGFCLLLLLLFWACLSAAVSDSFLRAFQGGEALYDGLFSYFVYAGMFVCAAALRGERQRRDLLRCFCAVILFLAMIMLMQDAGNAFLRACMPSKHAVVFHQFNHFGYLLCMAIICLTGLYLYDVKAGRLLRGSYLLGEAILVYALLINDTFGSYLAALAALPVVYLFYFKSGRKFRIVALLPVFVFLLISLYNFLGMGQSDATLAGNMSQLGTDLNNIATNSEAAAEAGTRRFIKWKDTLTRIGQRPVFGFGPDGFYGSNAITEGDAPHNEYLQIAGYLGIPALLLYLGALLTLMAHQWKRIRELDSTVLVSAGVTVTYLFSAFFGNPVYNTAPYFWLFLGLTTAVCESETLLFHAATESDVKNLADVRQDRIVLLTVIGIVLAGTVFGIWERLVVKDEHICEFADLQAMRNAELTLMADQKFGRLSEDGDYWYDADSYSLLSVDQPVPAPYGMGTALRGDTWYEFMQQFGQFYDYNESIDYRDKIIRVSVKTGEDGEQLTDIQWVSTAERENVQ